MRKIFLRRNGSVLFKCKNGFKRTVGGFLLVKNNRSAILLFSLFKRKQKEPIYKNVVCLRHRNALIGRAKFILCPLWLMWLLLVQNIRIEKNSCKSSPMRQNVGVFESGCKRCFLRNIIISYILKCNKGTYTVVFRSEGK